MSDDYVKDWLNQQGMGKGIKTLKGLRRYRTIKRKRKEGEETWKVPPSWHIKGNPHIPISPGVITDKMSRAAGAVRYALRIGRIKKPNLCQQCNLPRALEAHHFDYNKPLEVEWLCHSCHIREPRGINWKD